MVLFGMDMFGIFLCMNKETSVNRVCINGYHFIQQFQVKEVGIYLVDCQRIAEDVETYYDNLWKLAHLDPSKYTKLVTDHEWQIVRKVPCWSQFFRKNDRCK